MIQNDLVLSHSGLEGRNGDVISFLVISTFVKCQLLLSAKSLKYRPSYSISEAILIDQMDPAFSNNTSSRILNMDYIPLMLFISLHRLSEC